ncbi:hypothetical protein IFR05_012913 [Cadophora sp. M221]|nr:hypothetical protein IFR05_012913 [Cadophora sp. M221]
MGHGLQAHGPFFTNQVTLLITRKYNKHFLSPAAAEYVFKRALSGSKLRKFTRDLIFAVGPFIERDDNEKNRPWLPKKQYKYLQDEDDKTPEDWLTRKAISQLNQR